MIEGMFGGGVIPVLEKAMAFREARHQLLAGNIANASTPGYRPVDLDESAFQRQLADSVRDRAAHHPGRFALRPSEQVAVGPDGRMVVRPAPARAGQVRHDGNGFSVEREMAALADNTLAHNLAAQLLGGSFRLLEVAIRGRV